MSYYPHDPLDSLESLELSYNSNSIQENKSFSSNSFRNASKEILTLRPTLPVSDHKIVKVSVSNNKNKKQTRSILEKMGQKNGNASLINRNHAKSKDTLVKLCRQGWTYAKVRYSSFHILTLHFHYE